MSTGPNLEVFATTRWSLVQAAGDGLSARRVEALEELCRAYWYPLYAFVRRRGHDEHEAKDLTQGFFERLLQKNDLAHADSDRGRFRTFLLSALQHFLANEWDKLRRLKRGGGAARFSLDEPEAEARFQLEATETAPWETLFDRGWAESVLQAVMARLRREVAAEGDEVRYEAVQGFLWGGDGAGSYLELAARLGVSETGARSIVHRFRKRFRDLIRAEVAQTVARPEDVDDEIRHLFAALARGGE